MSHRITAITFGSDPKDDRAIRSGTAISRGHMRRKKIDKPLPQQIADRLEALSSQCDPECYGRCRECPDNVRWEAINYLRNIE